MINCTKRSQSLILVCVLSLSAFAATDVVDGGWDQLPGILENIKTPTFPNRDFDITRFGAKADGQTDCTAAIKQAIAQCHAAGGGRVLVPGPGTYYTGPVHLKSNVHLEVAKGATLLFSDNFMDYLPPVLVRWEGEECYSLSPLIYANDCENIAITGQGTLRGNGRTWWNWRKRDGDPYRAANNIKKEWSQSSKPVTERILAKENFHWCPTFIGPYNSKNVLIEGLTLIDGPFWNVHPVYCQSVIVRNLTIRNHGPNGDGCNPDSCQYVLIEGCLFDTGDDCIAIKSGKNNDGRRVNRPSEYIIVRNCIMKEGHGGVVMGSEMTGGVRNVYAENCAMDSPNLDRALRIKTNSVRGGTVENVYMRNVKVGQVADAVFKVNFQYGEKDTGAFTPMVRNINMENVTCNKSKYGVRIDAYERSPVSGIYLKNCSFMNVEKGNILNHVKDLTVDKVTINGKSVDNRLQASARPNIVLILADDLGVHQLGCYGSDFYETPNIDQLAAEGMRFTNAYAACHVCSPTRASIMTGKYPARLGITDYIPGWEKGPKGARLIQPKWNMHLVLDEVTVAESLKAAGYATGHFGKWHLNVDKKYRPGRAGDPGSQGFDDVLTTHKPKAGPPSKYENDAHHVREITEASVAFIEKNRDRPFFCYVTHNSIHSPQIERETLIAKYKARAGASKGGRLNPIHGAMLETLDKSVGQICTKIKSLGIEQNTVVVFFSDNGQQGPDEGEPFRGSKGNFYEGGIRMPFVIKWPGVTAAGSVCDELMISTDFFPTFNEMAGVTSFAQDVDGISLVPVLQDAKARLGRQAIYWHFPHYRKSSIGPHGAMRKGKYKLVEWYEKSAFAEHGAFELYDLVADPGERKDLARSKARMVKAMSEEFTKWRRQVGAQEMSKK